MEVVDRIALAPTTSRGPHQNVPEVSVIIKHAREVKAAPAPKPAAPKPVAPKP